MSKWELFRNQPAMSWKERAKQAEGQLRFAGQEYMRLANHAKQQEQLILAMLIEAGDAGIRIAKATQQLVAGSGHGYSAEGVFETATESTLWQILHDDPAPVQDEPADQPPIAV